MATRYRGSPREVRALDAFIALMRCSDTVLGGTGAPYAEVGLTNSQFGVLEALLHVGPMQQKELAAKILRSSGNIVMVVDNLEKRGLVTRQRLAEDRRCVRVELTEAGSSLILEVFPRVLESIVSHMEALTGAEQEELHRLCRKLGLAARETRVRRGGGSREE